MAAQKIVYNTPSGRRMVEARGEAREAKARARKLEEIPEAGEIVARLESEAREKDEEADRLWTAARIEALTVYQGDVEKVTGRGTRRYTYWYASWREGSKVRNVHIGSIRRLDFAAAQAKARKIKASRLGGREEEEDEDGERGDVP